MFENTILTGFIFATSLFATINQYRNYDNKFSLFRVVMVAGTICAGIIFGISLFGIDNADADELQNDKTAKTDWVFHTVNGNQYSQAYYTQSDPMTKIIDGKKVSMSVTFVCDKRKPNPIYTLLTLVYGRYFGNMDVVFDVDKKRLNNGPSEYPRHFIKFPGQYKPAVIAWPNPYDRRQVDAIVSQTDLRITWNEISLNNKLYITVDVDGIGIVEFGGTHDMGQNDPFNVIQKCVNE